VSTVPFTQLRSLRGLVLAPDRRNLAFVALRPSLESNVNLAEILCLELAAGTVRTLSACAGVPDGPVWLGSERLAYALGKDVYEVDLAGSVRRRAHYDRPLRQLAAVPGTDLLLAAVAARAPEEGEPFWTNRLPYKRDGRGRVHGPDHLVAIAADGRIVDLGPGYLPRPSADGRRLAHLEEADSLEFLDARLVVRDLDAAALRLGPPERQEVPRSPQAMEWSPGGRLAVLAQDEVMGLPRPVQVLVGQPGAAYRNWTQAQALWPGMDAGDWTYSPARLTLAWRSEEELLVLDQYRGTVRPLLVREGATRVLAPVDGVLSDAVVDPADGTPYAVLETPTRPHEIVRLAPDSPPQRLTDLNPFTFPEPEHFTVAGADGEEVDVYALFAGEGPGPTAFAIHGGPHAAFMRAVYLDHHMLRDEGISVVWSNPHGSTGYSRAFAEALVGRWGELDETEWRAIRRRLEEMGRAPTRLAVWGTSYGGYMATWLAGHLEDVAAAVIQAPVVDQVSMMGSSDIGYSFTPRGLGFPDPVPLDVADLDERVARAWRNSPLRTYPNIQAATLILVGDSDDRCPVSQAEELYTLLRHRNRQPVELVVYPGESHLIARHGRPRTRDDRRRRIAAWLVRHLR
jgi:dienelactone hydrolase